jgi:hypothetical protein
VRHFIYAENNGVSSTFTKVTMATEIKTRTYAVSEAESGKLVALIEAQNNVQVFSHMARQAYTVAPATQAQMYEAGQSGVKLEKASALVETASA